MKPDIYFGSVARAFYERWPLTLIDVGARGGLQPNWRKAGAHLRLIGFEPDPDEHARLAAAASTRVLHINAAVGCESGAATLNVGREGGTSSLLAPNMEFLQRFPRAERYDVVRQVTISTDRLDNLLGAHAVVDADFIKVDTQGAELGVLEGARETLARSVFGIEVEVLFAPLYRDQPSFGAVDDYLRARGFQLFDLRPSYWKRKAGARYGGPKGQLVFADALYFKCEEALREQLRGVADDVERSSKLMRALSVCLVYGYNDYAIELLEANENALPADMAAAIKAQLCSDVPLSARLPHFRGKGWLSHLFYRWHRALFPTVGGWASGGRHLGNVE